jgi:hypothetical protein
MRKHAAAKSGDGLESGLVPDFGAVELPSLGSWVIISRLGEAGVSSVRSRLMLTRRSFHIVLLSTGAAAFAGRASSQQSDTVTIRIRVDESVRAAIPILAQRNLTIEPDQSEEAKALARRAPPERAVPILFIIVGAMAVPVVLQMIREALRQTYYGGVVLDMRSQPPSVISDPKIPGDMVFVIESGGKTTRYTSDQLSPALLGALLKEK